MGGQNHIPEYFPQPLHKVRLLQLDTYSNVVGSQTQGSVDHTSLYKPNWSREDSEISLMTQICSTVLLAFFGPLSDYNKQEKNFVVTLAEETLLRVSISLFRVSMSGVSSTYLAACWIIALTACKPPMPIQPNLRIEWPKP